jgi:AraC family transcriptional regulator, regulatory protein of adaptative response / DNA-3-methyladenine glycosylase II
VPGIEEVEDGVYRRTALRAGRPGVVTVDPNDPGPDERARLVLGLDQDTERIDAALAADALLAPLVEARPGLRVPGAWDGFELAVRAVLGQQVSVAAGRRLGEALLAAYGEPLRTPSGGLTRLFPRAERLAEEALGELGTPDSRRDTVRAVSAALADGAVRLDPGADRDEAEKSLLGLRGVGPWTAGYVRMRALSDPDVLLTADVAVRAGMRATGAAAVDSEAWRPWRSYAMHHFWNAARDRGDFTRHDRHEEHERKDR